MKDYTITPNQKRMIDDVKNLYPKRLYYLVIQQNRLKPNLTINELKKHVRNGIKSYVRTFFSLEYRTNLENELIQYVCFLETSKEFQQSLYQTNLNTDEVYLGLHFHLFISSRSGQVHIPQLIHYIFLSLTSQPLKSEAIKLFDYFKVENLDERFIQYHTKQHFRCESPEMYMKNI